VGEEPNHLTARKLVFYKSLNTVFIHTLCSAGMGVGGGRDSSESPYKLLPVKMETTGGSTGEDFAALTLHCLRLRVSMLLEV